MAVVVDVVRNGVGGDGVVFHVVAVRYGVMGG